MPGHGPEVKIPSHLMTGNLQAGEAARPNMAGQYLQSLLPALRTTGVMPAFFVIEEQADSRVHPPLVVHDVLAMKAIAECDRRCKVNKPGGDAQLHRHVGIFRNT